MTASQPKYFPILAIALLCLLGASSASADTQDAWSPATSGITTNKYPGYPLNLGIVFTSNVNGTVSALGIYAGNDDSYSESETVGLYLVSTGALLTEATVTDTDSLSDGYYWSTDLSNTVSVTEGTQYAVVDFVGVNGWGDGSLPTNNWATLDYATFEYNRSTVAFDAPNPVYGQYAYYGGNVQLGGTPPPTPEPSSLFLFGSGLLGMAGVLRRKLRRS